MIAATHESCWKTAELPRPSVRANTNGVRRDSVPAQRSNVGINCPKQATLSERLLPRPPLKNSGYPRRLFGLSRAVRSASVPAVRRAMRVGRIKNLLDAFLLRDRRRIRLSCHSISICMLEQNTYRVTLLLD